jgi:hypothetical protein
LRVNFTGSEFEKIRNKEDAKQQAKTAKRIAEIDHKLAALANGKKVPSP